MQKNKSEKKGVLLLFITQNNNFEKLTRFLVQESFLTRLASTISDTRRKTYLKEEKRGN